MEYHFLILINSENLLLQNISCYIAMKSSFRGFFMSESHFHKVIIHLWELFQIYIGSCFSFCLFAKLTLAKIN